MATATGSQVTLEEPGNPFTEWVYTPEGSQVALESPAAPSIEQLYVPQSSEAGVQSGTPTLRFTVAPAGAQVALEDGTGAANQPSTLTPNGSELDAQDPGAATTEFRYEPQGGVNAEVGTEHGAPTVQQFSGILSPPGSELRAEIPLYMEAFIDLLPDGSEVGAQAGTARTPIALLLVATGSQLTTQSGIPALAMQLLPAGSQLQLQSGAPLLPNLPVLLVPAGSQLSAQFGQPLPRATLFPASSQLTAESAAALVLEALLAQGSELAAQHGTGIAGAFGLSLLPFGSELTYQAGAPETPWYLVPEGSELVLQVGIPGLPGLRQVRLILRDASLPRFELIDVSSPKLELEVSE